MHSKASPACTHTKASLSYARTKTSPACTKTASVRTPVLPPALPGAPTAGVSAHAHPGVRPSLSAGPAGVVIMGGRAV
ncbi:hypothetical protein BOTBODRAFT_56388 [Botryobasidium botryosum FD-172 SS1]|uniref:Uncharacterized protein n=1 Tax=Botryobasidium botryosum (strain FD-172 SS1) TaxID=930990 RepID=A0A067MNE6_BOTB1|nr:hypothetical protein BOTBODRAFT_56388 [Botryobasidium botryosum FD-172 SS1]